MKADQQRSSFRVAARLHSSLSPLFPLVVVGLLSVIGAPAADAQVSLYTAVDLALRNSTSVRMAAADVQRAAGTAIEAKDVYIPNLAIGSGLGYSYGFPLGQPSIFNVTSQSLVFSYSQRDYLRAARNGVKAAELTLKDIRQQVVLDTALDYIELDKIIRELDALGAENAAAERLTTIQQQRVDAGLEGRTELLRAQLTAAQVRLKRLHIEDDAALLRARLAHLTGLPAGSIVTASDSIPAPASAPDGPALIGELGTMAGNTGNQGVLAAYAAAKAHRYTAIGDSRQIFRPQIGFGAQYSLFSSTFNNYSEFYRNFQPSNVAIGISITVPLYDRTRKDHAVESAADAAHADAQADQLRDQVSEQSLQLQKSLAELAAQEEVARIQSEISQSELETVLAQLQSGNGSATAPQLTPKDEQQARIQERQRYLELLDTRFELTRAQLNLLRATGAIEDWARKSPQH